MYETLAQAYHRLSEEGGEDKKKERVYMYVLNPEAYTMNEVCTLFWGILLVLYVHVPIKTIYTYRGIYITGSEMFGNIGQIEFGELCSHPLVSDDSKKNEYLI